MQALEFLEAFLAPLNKAKISYFVTGSVASIFYGEPRLTHDVDIVVHLSQKDVSQFFGLFPLEHFYCPPEEVIQIEINRRPFGHFNLIHHETGKKADIYTDADDKLHHWAFQKRKQVTLKKSFDLWLAPPEYVIIRKLEYYRDGGSDKHVQDIKKMLPQVREDLDMAFLMGEIIRRKLDTFWQQVSRS